jgi:hypothetical protein
MSYINTGKAHKNPTVSKKEIVVDGRGHLLGRLASVVAKHLVNGVHVTIVRVEEINQSGSRTLRPWWCGCGIGRRRSGFAVSVRWLCGQRLFFASIDTAWRIVIRGDRRRQESLLSGAARSTEGIHAPKLGWVSFF